MAMERIKLIIDGTYLLLLKYMPYRTVKRNMKSTYFVAESDVKRIEDEIIAVHKDSDSIEEREIACFLKRYGLWNVFPYKFCFNYLLKAAVSVRYDKKEKMYYVIRNGKKLFFKQGTLTEAVNYYNSILCEQDRKSPHFYNAGEMKGNYFFDCGAAEGFLALDVIDKFEKLYIFEADKDWVRALQKTFEPYQNKVKIINKFLSDKVMDGEISIDSFIAQNDVDIHKSIYMKMDVEGYESKVIKGASVCISNAENLNMFICTYHKYDDAEKLRKQVMGLGKFTYKYSNGYMILFYAEDNRAPFLRRGGLRMIKDADVSKV